MALETISIGAHDLRTGTIKFAAETIAHRAEHGILQMDVASAERHGLPPRKDQGDLHKGAKSIYEEGLRMRAVDEHAIAPDIRAVTFSTVPASGHTLFDVNYADARACWNEALAQFPCYSGPTGKDMVMGGRPDPNKDGTFLPPTHLPGQLIAWVMLKVPDASSAEGFLMTSVDMYQLAQAQETGVLTYKVHNKEQSVSVTADVLSPIYRALETQMQLQRVYLDSLYTKHIKPVLVDRLGHLGIQLKDDEDVVSISQSMALGYSRDKKEKMGVGGGPQSGSSTHIHTTLVPDIDKIRELVVERVMRDVTRDSDYEKIVHAPEFRHEFVYDISRLLQAKPNISNEEIVHELSSMQRYGDIDAITQSLERWQGWIGEHGINMHAVKQALIAKAQEVTTVMKSLDMVFAQNGPILGKLTSADPKTFPPHLLFKQIDPYSTIFYQHMGSTIENMLFESFQQIGLSREQLQSFVWHAEPNRFDMRITEGWRITLSDADFARVNTGLNTFLHKMQALWTEGSRAWESWKIYRDDRALKEWQQRHHLTETVVSIVKQIVPTDEQIAGWLNDSRLELTDRERKKLELRLQRRYDPKLRERAARRIQYGTTLENRVTDAGLFQVLGKRVATEDALYMQDTERVPYQFNRGLNIPGDPGWGIVYEKLGNGDGTWVIRIHPLLSEKANAEFSTGTVFNRIVVK